MRLLITLLAALSLLPSPAGADAVTEAIKKGGVAILMRHATAPGTFDPDHFKLDVNGCAKPTVSGDAKKAGMVFAASEPGQGRAQPGEANP